jgi:hypothetical protein
VEIPGRNDRCPCGRGKKYKKCCGFVAAEIVITADDRNHAMNVLATAFSASRFADDRLLALTLFWGEERIEDGFDPKDEAAWLQALCIEWCVFDFVTASGVTVADYVLRHQRDRLTPGSRSYVERCAASPLRLVKVIDSDARGTVAARDLLDRNEHYVIHDRSASEDLVRHDVLIARLVPEGSDWTMEGMPTTLPVSDRERVVRAAKRSERRMAARVPDATPEELRMFRTQQILSFVVERAHARMPALRTTDGDPIALTDIVYEVGDYAAVRALLESYADISRDDVERQAAVDTFVWLDPKDVSQERRLLASIVLTPSQLRVSTLSETRTARVLGALRDLLRDGVRLVGLEHPDLAPPANGATELAEEIPSELKVELERGYYERHYRSWLDESVPMLHGLTPRAARNVPKLRAKLVALVEGIENQAEHLAREGGGFDASFLRQELRLRRS